MSCTFPHILTVPCKQQSLLGCQPEHARLLRHFMSSKLSLTVLRSCCHTIAVVCPRCPCGKNLYRWSDGRGWWDPWRIPDLTTSVVPWFLIFCAVNKMWCPIGIHDLVLIIGFWLCPELPGTISTMVVVRSLTLSSYHDVWEIALIVLRYPSDLLSYFASFNLVSWTRP
jgi:hypothetical protein